ncbi:hypothetical protein HDU87_002559 [Geranomyces variabilis]|uniref:Uncharacterized protein n=1 Tax=Geranomyces variabilis TaxID=109894 RepID=A0AAD5TW31_9FUNG|nr:hypothetical protein HDU87_002559 [Geranomyces variabilis]
MTESALPPVITANEQKLKTLAKRRSRSLSIWKEDVKSGHRSVVTRDDVAVSDGRHHHHYHNAVRRSRSLSPAAALAVEVKHVARDTKTAPKRRESRFQPPSSRRSSTSLPWSGSKRLSMSRPLKVHPSTVSLTDLTAETAAIPVTRSSSNKTAESSRATPEKDAALPIPPSVTDSIAVSAQPPKPRLAPSIEQAIYASAYRKIMDPTRPASARMTIANLMLYIQSVHPGVETLSELGESAWCLPSHSTSAPWKRDSSKSANSQTSSQTHASARPTAIKRVPSPVAVARKNNKKRLAKLAAGVRLGPGPSSLRKELFIVTAELPASIATATLTPPAMQRISSMPGLFTKRSLPHLSSTPNLLESPYCARAQSLRGSGRIDFQLMPVPPSALERRPATTPLKRVWRMIKQTLMLRDPVKRAQRRESSFYCTLPETSPRAPSAIHAASTARSPRGKEIM